MESLVEFQLPLKCESSSSFTDFGKAGNSVLLLYLFIKSLACLQDSLKSV